MSGTVLRVLTLIYSIQKQPLGIGVFPFIFPIFKMRKQNQRGMETCPKSCGVTGRTGEDTKPSLVSEPVPF